MLDVGANDELDMVGMEPDVDGSARITWMDRAGNMLVVELPGEAQWEAEETETSWLVTLQYQGPCRFTFEVVGETKLQA